MLLLTPSGKLLHSRWPILLFCCFLGFFFFILNTSLDLFNTVLTVGKKKKKALCKIISTLEHFEHVLK